MKEFLKERKIFEHHAYYLFKLLILIFGFSLILIFSFSVKLQFIILISVLLSYIATGFIHHQINHHFSAKIVIEYILISSIILAGFLLLNIGKI